MTYFLVDAGDNKIGDPEDDIFDVRQLTVQTDQNNDPLYGSDFDGSDGYDLLVFGDIRTQNETLEIEVREDVVPQLRIDGKAVNVRNFEEFHFYVYDANLSFFGSNSTEQLAVNGGNHYILGNGGDDRFVISESIAMVYGGDGDDIFDIQNSVGSFYGDDGDDIFTVITESGDLAIEGGRGSDALTLLYESGETTIFNVGFSRKTGYDVEVFDADLAPAAAIVTSSIEELDLIGIYTGSDTDAKISLIGSSQSEHLSGSGPNVFLIGQGGNDTLYAFGDGNHYFTGGSGNDLLVNEDEESDPNQDLFYFDNRSGMDTIDGFDADGPKNQDLLVFRDRTAPSYDDLRISQVGDDVMVSYKGTKVTLLDTNVADLGVDNFDFVSTHSFDIA